MSRNDTINYPVQGAAFHCLLWSFIELDQVIRKENWDTRIVGQIHDSILLDVNPAELDVVSHTVKHITTEALPKAWPWIIVPLEVEMDLAEVDHSWADLKKFTFA
jgi:DNA polymerase I-like protein with 3'-5' exonuclease and polymerase domains